MKIDISLTARSELKKKCHLCERELCSEYYDLDINFTDHEGTYGRYRNICKDCHCALKKQFTGVD